MFETRISVRQARSFEGQLGLDKVKQFEIQIEKLSVVHF